MARPIVIVHGWSDTAGSFTQLAVAMRQNLGAEVTTINLANWESMDDLVTYDDVVTRMNQAWADKGLPRTARSVDVIVHSTGSLVVRDWLVRFSGAGAKEGEVMPVYHFVMLAPANFGSPLAHKGTSLIGRVVKGWNSKQVFQVGALILKGLEVGSPYSWDMAMQDRFGAAELL